MCDNTTNYVVNCLGIYPRYLPLRLVKSSQKCHVFDSSCLLLMHNTLLSRRGWIFAKYQHKTTGEHPCISQHVGFLYAWNSTVLVFPNSEWKNYNGRRQEDPLMLLCFTELTHTTYIINWLFVFSFQRKFNTVITVPTSLKGFSYLAWLNMAKVLPPINYYESEQRLFFNA